VSVEVQDKNPAAFHELTVALDSLAGHVAKAGIFDTALYNNDAATPVAQTAMWQEFGVPRRGIPPRPFMRPAIKENEHIWMELLSRLSDKVIEGKMTARDAMALVGERAQGDIIKSISKVMSPPLSLITLMARKIREGGGKVTGKTIGMLARKIKTGNYTPDEISSNTKPLVDTGQLVQSISSMVDKA